MESWILRLHFNFAKDPKYSMTWFREQTKIEFIAYIYIYYKYLNI